LSKQNSKGKKKLERGGRVKKKKSVKRKTEEKKKNLKNNPRFCTCCHSTKSGNMWKLGRFFISHESGKNTCKIPKLRLIMTTSFVFFPSL
jgi:hypothetical protein